MTATDKADDLFSRVNDIIDQQRPDRIDVLSVAPGGSVVLKAVYYNGLKIGGEEELLSERTTADYPAVRDSLFDKLRSEDYTKIPGGYSRLFME